MFLKEQHFVIFCSKMSVRYHFFIENERVSEIGRGQIDQSYFDDPPLDKYLAIYDFDYLQFSILNEGQDYYFVAGTISVDSGMQCCCGNNFKCFANKDDALAFVRMDICADNDTDDSYEEQVLEEARDEISRLENDTSIVTLGNQDCGYITIAVLHKVKLG